MKLQAELGEEKYDVEIRRDGENVFAVVDDRRYELEISEPERGVLLFRNGGKITEVCVSSEGRCSDPIRVQTGRNSYDIKLIDPKRLRGSAVDGDHGDGAAEVRTAMPGKVVRLLATSGAQVKKGDAVVVVEAMKMQNELKAPKAGTVTRITVEEGATVGPGDVLVIIE